jgi:hypothetical protein
MTAAAPVTPTNVVLGALLQHASGRRTLHTPLKLTPPSTATYPPTTPADALVQFAHELAVERPKPGAEATVDESSNVVLASIHAPDAGTLRIEFDRR